MTANASDRWTDIKNTYGEEAATALKALYDYYDGEGIANWITSLFDPKTGGFYYCKSARDTEGYLPDLESTQQAFGILSEIGAIPTDRINDMLSENVREALINFVHYRQSPIDGYYYHPQWPVGKDKLATDRYGRDTGNAASVLRRVKLGENGCINNFPAYCTPDGKKCTKHINTDEVCSFPIPLPERIRTVLVHETKEKNGQNGENSSAAKIAKGPDYTSKETFITWLKDFSGDILEASGRAHNLAALAPEIQSHGYADVLIEYLDEMQKKLFDEQTRLGEIPTGIWQRAINYKAVWGMFKYAYIYNMYGKPINIEYVPYMIDTAIEVIKLPPLKNYAYNDLMNQWTAINGVISNVRRHHGDEIADKLYSKIRSNSASLIKNSLEKMLPFKMEDGPFCNNVNGFTSPVIYGVPIAVGNIAEGNVNSTHILLNMYFAICSALGCPAVPLCDVSVGETVAKKLSDAMSK